MSMILPSELHSRRWSVETMHMINKLTPDIKGKAFHPDWFLLRQRLEQADAFLSQGEIDELRSRQARRVMPIIGGLLEAWDSVPNDQIYGPAMDNLARHLEQIDAAMEFEKSADSANADAERHPSQWTSDV